MSIQPAAPGQYGAAVGCSALVVFVPLVLGWVCGRARVARALIVALGAVALALTLLGLFSLTRGRTLGVGDPDLAGLPDILRGYLSTFAGLLLAFAACGAVLTQARRAGRRVWLVLALVGALLPLLATIGLFDYLILVVEQFHGGEPVAFSTELLVFQVAPVGCVVPLIYGLVASRAHVERPIVSP